ncbi:hypothetical protein CY34DRAFT_812031 [Suillus luteus UH-Slu-Lm8-n1]|uniref:Uncharacterized protein n=1 Tax=Suillus luteus UH-Slu-Lm8-n1 TaxID=930992 RepID=A0A0D0A1H2_9AGAM|nr:hypothetical protein CY34DRAFT_812031 [Suillus luteus UH-Slu-Lm8-n1]
MAHHEMINRWCMQTAYVPSINHAAGDPNSTFLDTSSSAVYSSVLTRLDNPGPK